MSAPDQWCADAVSFEAQRILWLRSEAGRLRQEADRLRETATRANDQAITCTVMAKTLDNAADRMERRQRGDWS